MANSRFGSISQNMSVISPNPISPASSAYWLYVPRAHIVIPTGTTPPPVVTNYYLGENGTTRFLSEDGANLFILES